VVVWREMHIGVGPLQVKVGQSVLRQLYCKVDVRKGGKEERRKVPGP
jgi:hypothetical protein